MVSQLEHQVLLTLKLATKGHGVQSSTLWLAGRINEEDVAVHSKTQDQSTSLTTVLLVYPLGTLEHDGSGQRRSVMPQHTW